MELPTELLQTGDVNPFDVLNQIGELVATIQRMESHLAYLSAATQKNNELLQSINDGVKRSTDVAERLSGNPLKLLTR